MITEARKRALHWFNDHALDVNAVIGRKQPTKRMRNLMIRQCQLKAQPIAFSQRKYLLTEHGKAILAEIIAKKKHRQRKEKPP